MLLALAALLAAAPARADMILAAALEGFSVTRARVDSALEDERKALSQLKADLSDSSVLKKVLAAFMYVAEGGVIAEKYVARGRELEQRLYALDAELERARTLPEAEAALAVAAARKKGDVLRLDVLTWTLLPSTAHDIDERRDMSFAASRPAIQAGMRQIAYTGDFEAARNAVLESLGIKKRKP